MAKTTSAAKTAKTSRAPSREELQAQLEELDRADTIAQKDTEIESLKAQLKEAVGQRDQAMETERKAVEALKEIDKVLHGMRYRIDLGRTGRKSVAEEIAERREAAARAAASAAYKRTTPSQAVKAMPEMKPSEEAGNAPQTQTQTTPDTAGTEDLNAGKPDMAEMEKAFPELAAGNKNG